MQTEEHPSPTQLTELRSSSRSVPPPHSYSQVRQAYWQAFLNFHYVNHLFSQCSYWLHLEVTVIFLQILSPTELKLFFWPHRWCFSRGLLHPDHIACQAWPTVLLVVHLQWTGSPAAGCGSGTLTCLPVWGSEWQACPRGLPAVQDIQPCWRKVCQISDAYLSQYCTLTVTVTGLQLRWLSDVAPRPRPKNSNRPSMWGCKIMIQTDLSTIISANQDFGLSN